MELSRLEKVDLREVWAHEASGFTQWLAKPENLELLSDAIGIGINISSVQTEAGVGKFSVDILAEEENTGEKIVIENQLEKTDHDHLGKIITYASGVGAETLVWIVKELREEHKRAVDWLNEHTDGKINIFAIQIEVWRISGSPPAPRFHIIAEPNDWAKEVKKVSVSNELSDTKLLQLEFWIELKEYISERDSTIKLRKPYPNYWYGISIGSSMAHIDLTVNIKLNQIACEIYIPKSKPLFTALYKQKDNIENELGGQLDWQELEDKKASRIKLATMGDISNQDRWEEYHSWMFDKVIKFAEVFGKHIKQYTD